MKVAIMQPYFFPYIGYFQLIQAVDVFVFYDDVNFIKGGWIHRNRLLLNKTPHFISLPLIKQSSFLRIDEIELNIIKLTDWKKKLFKSLQINYANAPYFDETIKIVEYVLASKTNKISDLASLSVQSVMNYLEIEKKYFNSSQAFSNTKSLGKADRLIKISKEVNCTQYVNMMGGRFLYDKNYFKSNNVQLNFLNPQLVEYSQFGDSFHPGLSIIDVLMFNSKEEIIKMLNDYQLI